jgi:protocatechuate 3,4-dioxygenase beta subunit
MRAAFGRVGGIVLAAALATGFLAAPAQAAPSTITGTITAAATGESLQGCVSVYDLGYSFIASACTDDSGQWTAEGVDTGVGYKVQASAFDSLYKEQWSGGASTFEDAAVVEAPTHLDFPLEYAHEVGDSSLSGTITADDTGAPLQACVSLTDEADTYIASTCAAEDGTWTVGGLVAGAGYKVEFEANDDVHVGEWANDATSYATADFITAPATVDAALAKGGHLQGTLTRADGQPAEGASVSISSSTDDGSVAAFASTDQDGAWSALVRPGEYVVNFDAWPANQWAYGKTSRDDAAHFTVAPGDSVRVDDQFLAAAKVQGTVTSDATGAPVEGACVAVLTPTQDPYDTMQAGEGCTGPDGTYSIDISEPGEYIAAISDPQGRYAGEYSGNTQIIGSAQTFRVDRGVPATVNASIAKGAVITGLAVDAKSGAPIADACPGAYAGHAGGSDRFSLPVCSGADGRWTIRGLPAGDFAVVLSVNSQPRTYSDTWAFKATSQATADLIAVRTGQVTKVRNVQLKPGGRIAGRITDYQGQPVEGAYVSIDSGYSGRAGGPSGPAYAQTDADGRYTIYGVPAGDHTVFVEPDQWGGLAPLWSGKADRREDAVALRVKATRTTSYDAILQPGARISGSVVTAEGQPTTDYWMGIIRTTSGDYIGDFDVYNGNTFSSTSLPPGDFKLALTRYTDTGQGETIWYDSATSAANATTVSLARGEQREITVHLP